MLSGIRPFADATSSLAGVQEVIGHPLTQRLLKAARPGWIGQDTFAGVLASSPVQRGAPQPTWELMASLYLLKAAIADLDRVEHGVGRVGAPRGLSASEFSRLLADLDRGCAPYWLREEGAWAWRSWSELEFAFRSWVVCDAARGPLRRRPAIEQLAAGSLLENDAIPELAAMRDESRSAQKGDLTALARRAAPLLARFEIGRRLSRGDPPESPEEVAQSLGLSLTKLHETLSGFDRLAIAYARARPILAQSRTS